MTVYKIFIKDLFLDAVWEVLYFPVWWYSRGFKKTAFFCLRRIKLIWRALALTILFINFFRPMYAQRGWDAYVLSLAGRCWQIFWRLILLILWAIFWILVIFSWLILPFFVIWQLLF